MFQSIKLFNHVVLTFYNHSATTTFYYNMKNLSIPIILLGLLGLSFFKLKRKSYEILSVDATEQIRGLAILTIILSHYITRIFVTLITPYYWVFKDAGAIGVGAFLLISGFGVMSSFKKTGYFPKLYIFKRFLRILLPYWFFVPIWIFLDMYLLHLHHTLKQLISGVLGIVVIGGYTKDLNPSMWFVTFILFLSILFYLVFSLPLKRYMQIALLFLASSSAILISRYLAAVHGYVGLIQWGDYSLFFPTGGLLAEKYDTVKKVFASIPKKELLPFYGLLLITVLIFGQYYMVLLILLIMIPVWALAGKKLFSPFLFFLGSISYELYLVHVPFLIKYDFLLFRPPYFLSFFIYFGIMVGIATLVHKYISGRLMKKIFSYLRI